MKKASDGLSEAHIEKHILDWTDKWLHRPNGGHGGLSTNTLTGLLREPAERLIPILTDLWDRKLIYGFGCAFIKVPIWYNKQQPYGVSRFGWKVDGTCIQDKKDCMKYALEMAQKYPNISIYEGVPSQKEFARVVRVLGVKVPEKQMTDDTCIHCATTKE